RFRHLHPAVTGFSENAMAALKACAWPGNVRQLQNAIEHAMSYEKESTVIDVQDLPSSVTKPKSVQISDGLDEEVTVFKRERVERALADGGWDFEIAAAKLGYTSSYLYRLVQKLKIRRP